MTFFVSAKEDEFDPVRSQAQLKEATLRLEELFVQTEELVSNVRVAGDARESERRFEAENALAERTRRIDADLLESEKKYTNSTNHN